MSQGKEFRNELLDSKSIYPSNVDCFLDYKVTGLEVPEHAVVGAPGVVAGLHVVESDAPENRLVVDAQVPAGGNQSQDEVQDIGGQRRHYAMRERGRVRLVVFVKQQEGGRSQDPHQFKVSYGE